MAKTLTVKEVCEKIGCEPRQFRKFLRKEVTEAGGTVGEDTPGKGGRYSFEAREVNKLQRRFEAWNEARRSSPEEEQQEEAEVTEAE